MANVNTKTLMNRLIELTLPNNHRIEAIKAMDAAAKETIDEVKEENKELSAQLKENDEKLVQRNINIEGVVRLKDALLPSAKEFINILEANPNIPFDINAISASCKNIVDEDNRIIDEIMAQNDDLKSRIDHNDEKKSAAKQAIKDAESNLYQEEQYRVAISSLIEKSIAENGRSLAKERIEDELRDYYGDLFNEEEMESICKILQYPKEGLVEAMQTFEGKSKSTTDMVREAMEHSNDHVEESTVSFDNTRKLIEELKKIDQRKQATSDMKIKVVNSESDKVDKTVNNGGLKVSRVTPASIKSLDKSEPDFKSFLKDKLGVTDEDIKFNPQIETKSQKEIENMISKLEALGIDPKSVNLRTYYNNFDQFLANIKALEMSNYRVDLQALSRNPYLSDIPTDAMLKNIAIVNRCGYSLIKPNGKVALTTLSRSSDKLYSAICLISELDPDYFQNPENMTKKVADIAGRMYYCIQNGIDFKGDNYKLVENADEFESYYGERVDSSIIPSAKECNQAVLDNISNPEVVQSLMELYRTGKYLTSANLTSETIGRFNEICMHINDVDESSSKKIIEINGCKFLAARTYSNVRYLLSKGIDATDQDIIVASLMYGSHNGATRVSEIENRFNPNSVSLRAA